MLLRVFIFVMDYINIVCVVSHLHIWDGLHKHSVCCFAFTYLGWITLTYYVLFRIYIFGMDYINIVCVASHLHICDGLH